MFGISARKNAGVPMVNQVMTVKCRGRKTNSTSMMLVRVKKTTSRDSTAE